MAVGITERGRQGRSLCQAGWWKNAEPKLGRKDQPLEEGGSSTEPGAEEEVLAKVWELLLSATAVIWGGVEGLQYTPVAALEKGHPRAKPRGLGAEDSVRAGPGRTRQKGPGG